MRAHDDEEDRWPTVDLRPDQFENVLATDVVETIRIDQHMALAMARAQEQQVARSEVHFGAPIALCSLAILFGSLALLLDSGLWQVSWATAGIVAFTVVAVAAAVGSMTVLVRRLRER